MAYFFQFGKNREKYICEVQTSLNQWEMMRTRYNEVFKSYREIWKTADYNLLPLFLQCSQAWKYAACWPQRTDMSVTSLP